MKKFTQRSRIYSVINRKGEVFKIGDSLKSLGGVFKISHFEAKANYVYDNNDINGHSYIMACVKKKKGSSFVGINIDFIKKA